MKFAGFLTAATGGKGKAGLLRLMNISIILLAISPLLFWVYLQLKTGVYGVASRELIESSPILSASMVEMFMGPFMAYLLMLQKKCIEQETSHEKVYLNLALLLLSKFMVMNFFYVCVFALLLYKTLGFYNEPFLKSVRSMGIKDGFKDAGGSILVLLFHGFILFVMLRLRYAA